MKSNDEIVEIEFQYDGIRHYKTIDNNYMNIMKTGIL